MHINFKALEQALAPIENIGRGELTFDAGGVDITLSVLLPPEDREVQQYAAVALEGDKDQDPSNATEFIDRFRVGILSYAIVQVGRQDFRNVDLVETSEMLEREGKEPIPVKIPRVQAMRLLVGRWSRPLLIRAYQKYVELLSTVEKRAEQAVKFTPSDRDAEIERLEERVAGLKRAKEEEAQQARDEISQRTHAIEAAGAQQLGKTIEAPPEVQAPAPTAASEHAPASSPHRRTGSIIPQRATPPEPVAASPQPPVQTAASATPPAPRRMDTSFIDPGDEDSMNAAMAAEHQRIVEMRQRAVNQRPPMDEGAALAQVHPQLVAQRRPPHADAAEVEGELQAMEAAQAARAKHLGQVDGVEAFALPVQDLEVPQNRLPPDPKLLNPQQKDASARNPRFQNPRRP